MAKATWEGAILAESDDIVVIEGNKYFPPASIHREFFQPISQTSACPWKGTANYYDIQVNGKTNTAAAWYYAEPKPAASEIRGRIAFWKGVRVD